ncbi:hypothetical protein [Citricoccus nitrophenolicus]|uniref:hypothetical protein n=1 Tax=Citricoccus nitrophenolicus TaxID=863575 RepID=UPI00360F8A3C
MKIDRRSFEDWARGAHPQDEPFSLSKVAKAAGVSTSGFFLQAGRGQGQLDAGLIISYSRAVGLSPLGELLKFQQLQVFADSREPSNAEVLSQVPAEAHMEELVRRSRGKGTEPDVGPMPPAYALKRWMDCYDLWGKYDELARAMGLASAKSLTRKIADNKISVGELVDMVEYADLAPRFGLVVTGHLTLVEAGFDQDLRESVLTASTSAEVVESLRPALRWFEKEEEAKSLTSEFYQNLG